MNTPTFWRLWLICSIALVGGCGTPTTDSVDEGGDGTGDVSADVLVVPRSVGGGIAEADTFSVERTAEQATLLAERREAGAAALDFMRGVRRRFRRALAIARRIENASLERLNRDTPTADFTVTTPDGAEVCLRISNQAFAPAAGLAAEGGADLDADLEAGSDRIALRVWVNRSCSGVDDDYVRFYASIIERRPHDVELDEDDDSSEGAWRAGRGKAWIYPGALLELDSDYHAKCQWDHVDAAFRRTVFEEKGRVSPTIEIAGARYVVTREQTVDDSGQDLLCKRAHANVEFSEHPTILQADLRLGLCVSADEEGTAADRLLLRGNWQRKDGSLIAFGAACYAADAADDTSDCGRHLDQERLDLDDPRLMDEPVVPDDVTLSDQAFSDTAPDSESAEILDLDAP